MRAVDRDWTISGKVLGQMEAGIGGVVVVPENDGIVQARLYMTHYRATTSVRLNRLGIKLIQESS